MTKTENSFVISLDLGYAPHHCNPKKLIIYSHGVTECCTPKEEIEFSKSALMSAWNYNRNALLFIACNLLWYYSFVISDNSTEQRALKKSIAISNAAIVSQGLCSLGAYFPQCTDDRDEASFTVKNYKNSGIFLSWIFTADIIVSKGFFHESTVIYTEASFESLLWKKRS